MLKTWNRFCQHAPNQAAANVRQHHFFRVGLGDENSIGRSTVFIVDNDILRDIDLETSQVARLCCTQCRFIMSLTSTVAIVLVLQHAQAYTEDTTICYIE